VHIECTLEEKFIAIRISDTGVGYKGNLEDLLHKGIGLRNISKRLHLLYGQTLQVERNNNEGLVVSFRIPLNDDKVDSSVFNAPFAATSTKIAPVYRPY
jgi:sensor histidine kinase YesM